MQGFTAGQLKMGVYRTNRKPMKKRRFDIPFVMSVSMYPGTMAFTRMPLDPSSAARALVSPFYVSTRHGKVN